MLWLHGHQPGFGLGLGLCQGWGRTLQPNFQLGKAGGVVGWEDAVCLFPIPSGRGDVFKDAPGHRSWKGCLVPHTHCLSGLRKGSKQGCWTPENGAHAC